MRQSIETAFLAPTNHRGARIKAKCAARVRVFEWNHGLTPEGNHKLAAEKLADELQWSGEWHGGFNRDGRGVFVVADDAATFQIQRESVQ